jgi:hypothetical protein
MMQSNDQIYRSTVAKLQEKTRLQGLILSKYRDQVEKQNAEIDGLKVIIETQRIELQAKSKTISPNLRETKILKEDLRKAKEFAVKLNEHVENESKEKQRLIDAILKNAKKIQLDWEKVTIENNDLTQKINKLQKQYDEASWQVFKSKGNERLMSQKLNAAKKMLKNSTFSSSPASHSLSWTGNQNGRKYISSDRKLDQSARKIKQHLRRLSTPVTKRTIISTPSSKSFSLSNAVESQYDINLLRRQLDEFNETTKDIQYLSVDISSPPKYKNDRSMYSMIDESEEKKNTINEVISPIPHVKPHENEGEVDEKMITMITDEMLL